MNRLETSHRTFSTAVVTLGVVALAHALLTWPIRATLVLFGGGAILAFVAEAVVVHLELLDHHIGPKLFSVPLYVLFGWTGVIYVCLRIALLVTSGWSVILLAALLATVLDALTDPVAVADGRWTYSGTVPGPRHRGVPWWNYVGWFVVSAFVGSVALGYLP